MESRPEEPSGANALAGLLPLVLMLWSSGQVPGWLLAILALLGAFVLVNQAPPPSTRKEGAEDASANSGASRSPGEILELFGPDGMTLVAMKAEWGTWPSDEPASALAGDACLLPARALADPQMRRERAAIAGRIAVIQREGLRELGVRSWVQVARAVAAIDARSCLIVNVDDALAPLSCPKGTPSDLLRSLPPTALLRRSEGEVLLRALKLDGTSGESPPLVVLRVAGVEERAVAKAEELTAGARHAEAADVLASALEQQGTSPSVRLRVMLATSLRLAGRAEEALVQARACVDGDPESADGWVAVVQAHRALGQADAARTAAEQAVDLYEVDDQRLRDLVSELSLPPEQLAAERKATGNALFKEHKFTEARAAYTAALDALPLGVAEDLRAECHGNRAACAQQLHDWDAVVFDATQSLSVKPANVKVRVRRALAYEALEKYARALEDARETLRLQPGHAQANGIQHRAGSALRELGLTDSAKAANVSAKVTTAAPSQDVSTSETSGVIQKGPNKTEHSSEEGHVSASPQQHATIEQGSEPEPHKESNCAPNVNVPNSDDTEPMVSTASENAQDPCRITESPSGVACQSQSDLRVTELEAELAASRASQVQSDNRVTELEAELSSSRAARSALEERCAKLQHQLEEMQRLKAPVAGELPSEDCSAPECKAPTAVTSASAEPTGTSLSPSPSMRACGEATPSSPGAVPFSAGSSSGAWQGCESAASAASVARLHEERIKLHKALHRTHAHKQELHQAMEGFCARFAARCV